MQDRQWVVSLLRREGYTKAAEAAERELPDRVTMEEVREFADKHGVVYDDLISRMGGSP